MSAPGLESGLKILELVVRNKEIGFNQLKKMLELSPASLNRYLKLLLEQGFIARNENQQYTPGNKISSIYQLPDELDILREIIKPVLENISCSTGFTSLCIGFRNNCMICMDKQVVPEGLVMQEVGSVRTDYILHPWGYLLLSNQDDVKKQLLIENANATLTYGGQIPDKALLEKFIKEAGEKRFSDDKGLVYPGIRRISMPIYHRNKLTAALAVGILGNSLENAKYEFIIAALNLKATQLTDMLTHTNSQGGSL